MSSNVTDPFLILTILFAGFILSFTYLKGKIDLSAFLASGFVGILTIIFLGEFWYFIYVIFAFFIAGNLVSKYKYEIKKRNGVAQNIRTWRNVFGNGFSAIIFAFLYYLTHEKSFIYGFLGSMATASADTFATEIGEIYEKKPRLITKPWKRVRVGTSGAVSIPGFFGAILGAITIALITLLLDFYHNFTNSEILLTLLLVFAGFLGSIADSFLGATIEKKFLDTHLVNFFATFFGGAISTMFYFIL